MFTLLLLPRADGAEHVCCAILLGGFAASGVSGVWLTCLLRRDFRKYGPAARGLSLGRRLLKLCVPLAFGDYLRSGLRTLEQLLIPLGLSRAAGSSEAAMAAYGTVHGMVFPILMFPAAEESLESNANSSTFIPGNPVFLLVSDARRGKYGAQGAMRCIACLPDGKGVIFLRLL